jgi:putative transcriptional regulator
MKVKSRLHILMGEKKIRSINQLSKDTGITRRTLTRIYNDEAEQIDLKTLTTLCVFFNCLPGDLLTLEEEGEN